MTKDAIHAWVNSSLFNHLILTFQNIIILVLIFYTQDIRNTVWLGDMVSTFFPTSATWPSLSGWLYCITTQYSYDLLSWHIEDTAVLRYVHTYAEEAGTHGGRWNENWFQYKKKISPQGMGPTDNKVANCLEKFYHAITRFNCTMQFEVQYRGSQMVDFLQLCCQQNSFIILTALLSVEALQVCPMSFKISYIKALQSVWWLFQWMSPDATNISNKSSSVRSTYHGLAFSVYDYIMYWSF